MSCWNPKQRENILCISSAIYVWEQSQKISGKKTKSRSPSLCQSQSRRVAWRAVPQQKDLTRSCLPITLILDDSVSCYSLFYLKDYRSKLLMMFAKGHFVGNIIVEIFWRQVADPLCSRYDTAKDIGNILATVEGVVIKTFLIAAPILFPFIMCPIRTFSIFTCGCHNHLAWLPLCLLKPGFVTALCP